jgi:basic membrane lipoprotein Med (substrate-binding protein (PBP1-ABC) superfamily)
MATKSGNIGFVAAQPTSVANWEINAYTLGVRLNHPNATVHVIFIGTPDPAKEKTAASTLIDHGADVLGQSLDGPTPQIVAEERGVLATGHAVDLHELAPKSTICSSIWNWDRYLAREIKKIVAGNWTAGPDDGLIGMIGGSNDISCCSTAVPEKTIPKMIAERDGIIITQNQVFKGPLEDAEGKERVKAGDSLNDDELWAMNWYVKGVAIEK